MKEVLAQYGISQELVNAQLETTSVKLERISGAGEDAFASIGQAIGKVVANMEGPLVGALNMVSSGMQTLGNTDQIMNGLQVGFLTTTTTAEQFNAKVAESNGMLGNNMASFLGATAQGRAFGQLLDILVPKFGELNTVQYAYAQALLQNGANATVLASELARTKDQAALLNQYFEEFPAYTNASAESLNTFASAVFQASKYGQEGVLVGEAVIQNVANQSISFEQGLATLYAFSSAKERDIALAQEQAAATDTTTYAVNVFSEAVNKAAFEASNAAVETEAMRIQQETIANISGSVNSGLISIADGAAILAGQLNATAQQAEILLSKLQQLAIAKARQSFSSGAPENVMNGVANLPKAVENIKTTQEIVKAQQAWRDATSSTADKLADVNARLKYTKQGTKEWYELSTKQHQLEKQMESEEKKGKKGKGSKSPKLSDQEKLNNKLLSQQDKYHNKAEDAEREHWENVAKIVADGQKKIAEQEKKNEISKRRGRAGFYANNADLEEGVDPQKFAAQYEEAFAEAQRMAQAGQKQLSDEYLKLRQQQIEELRDLENEAAAIQNDEDLSKEDKQAAIEYINGRRKLIEDAQAEELKQLKEGGDAINNDIRERLDAEAAAYKEKTDKIALESERAAESTIKAQQRSRKAISETNLELAKQAGYLTDIAAKDGSKQDKSKATVPVSDVPITPTEPIPVTTQAPIPTVSTDILLVKQSEMFMVTDNIVAAAIQDNTARLEARLGELISAVNSGADRITSSVNGVERAVGNIRTSETLVQA